MPTISLSVPNTLVTIANTVRRITKEIEELGPSPLKAQLAEGE